MLHEEVCELGLVARFELFVMEEFDLFIPRNFHVFENFYSAQNMRDVENVRFIRWARIWRGYLFHLLAFWLNGLCSISLVSRH